MFKLQPNIGRLGLLVVAGLFSFSCTATRPSVEQGLTLEWQTDGAELAIEDAKSLLESDSFGEAADLLKSIGRQEGAVEHMDEVLYLLGKARLAMEEPGKAARCFTLLRRYFPRSPHRFPNLLESEARADSTLAKNKAFLPMVDNPGSQEANGITSPRGDIEQVNPGDAAPLVTNAFYETDVRQALMDISAQTGVSIVPGAMVRGYVTVELRDTPLEQALERILSPLGLTFGKMDGYYLVGAPAEDSPSHPYLTETVLVKPRYLRAEEVPGILPRFYGKYLRVDKSRNTISITASRTLLKTFEEDLAALDHPTPQIMIDVMVVETSSDTRMSLGLDWNYRGSEDEGILRVKLLPQFVDSLFIGEFTTMKSPFDLRVALQAMAAKGRVKIRANPRVATKQGTKAEIRIGKEVYFSLIQGSVNFPYFTLEKIPTGITLSITPYLGASSEITTDITAEVSDVVASGASGLPITNVRSVNTRIRVMNGQTITIGGLRSQMERQQEERIPFLGEIPLIGRLFGHTTTEKVETEIMILITPYVIIPAEEFDVL